MKYIKYFLIGILRIIVGIIVFITAPIWLVMMIGGGGDKLRETSDKYFDFSTMERL